MRNIRESLLSTGFYARTSLFRLHGKFMPRKRDPSVFTTSISGIPDDAWAAFKEEVKLYKKLVDSNYTLRKALEEAIFEHLKRHEHLDWNPRSIPTSHGKAVPIQISDEARKALKLMSERTGHKQNTILLTAMYHYSRKLCDAWVDAEFGPRTRQVKLGVDETGKPFPVSKGKMLAEIWDDYVEIKGRHLRKLHERLTGEITPPVNFSGKVPAFLADDPEDQTTPQDPTSVQKSTT